MNLAELLKQITPLPYHVEPGDFPVTINSREMTVSEMGYGVDSTQDYRDAAYLVHAANVLPELVEALEEINNLNTEDRTPDRLDHAILVAQKALAKAKEVQS
jgi:hypothetical protein